jgi:hypothetical protein
MTQEEKRLRHNETVKRWRLNNSEKVKELNRKNRSTPEAKEKHRIKMAEWRKNNPEKALEISRKNYKIHSTKYNEQRRIKYNTDAEYRAKKLNSDKEYNLSGKRKEAYNKNPNKEEILKKKWIKIKNGDYEKVRAKNRKYREEVFINKERANREHLNDSYVVCVIKKQFNYQIKTEEIPKDLIEAKRNILKLKRITKTKNHETRANL